jgi:hypothetical protein
MILQQQISREHRRTSTSAFLTEIPALIREIASGTFDIDARPMPPAQVERRGTTPPPDQRILVTP